MDKLKRERMERLEEERARLDAANVALKSKTDRMKSIRTGLQRAGVISFGTCLACGGFVVLTMLGTFHVKEQRS